jgi:phospholipase/carboxylesterase
MARPWIAAIAFISALVCASSSVSLPAKLDVGISAAGPYAFIYRPAAAGGVRPLIVLLHGAGQQARPFVEAMRGEADRCGCILLGVQSVGATWDLISAVNKPDRVRANFGMGGKDAAHIEGAIASLVANGSVDRRRVVLAGFSDGASYALSLGRAKPRLFRGIVAMAPGFQLEPDSSDHSQHIVIAHSETDRVLPFGRSHDAIFEPLKRAGYRAEFLTYQGGHTMDAEVMGHAIGLILDES